VARRWRKRLTGPTTGGFVLIALLLLKRRKNKMEEENQVVQDGDRLFLVKGGTVLDIEKINEEMVR
jgi:hypothetical protein